MATKLTLWGILTVAVGYWLRGHDILTGVALLVLFMFVSAKLVFAIMSRTREEPPPSAEGGSHPPGATVPIPPRRPTPLELSEAAKARHEPAA